MVGFQIPFKEFMMISVSELLRLLQLVSDFTTTTVKLEPFVFLWAEENLIKVIAHLKGDAAMTASLGRPVFWTFQLLFKLSHVLKNCRANLCSAAPTWG